jgi:hypothetical protein
VPEKLLYRLAALAGALAAPILVVNVLRRADVLPTNALTRGVAPFATVLALFAITGLYLWQRERAGRLGLVGYVFGIAGFAGAVGTEVTGQFVFANLPEAQVDQLVAGPARPAFTTIAAVFSLGALLFGAAMFRAGAVPRTAAAGYAFCLALFAWRNSLPELVVTVDGVVAGVVVGWLSWSLWRRPTGQGRLWASSSRNAGSAIAAPK